MDESGQKKVIRILLIVIGVLSLILVLLCGCFVLGNTVLQHDQEETEEEDDEDDADEDGEDEDEEYDEDGEDDEDEEADASEVLTKYYEKLLEDSEHPIDYYKQYSVSYEETEDGYACAGLLKDLDGPIAYDIRDYDQDGEEELLLLAIVENSNADGPENILEWQMYEIKDGEVKLQDHLETVQQAFGGVDDEYSEYYVKKDDDCTYLAERWEGIVNVLADGCHYRLRILHYDGEAFVEDASQGFSGSEFSGTEEDVAKTASELNGLGFTNSAAILTEELRIQPEDGLEELFIAMGQNSTPWEEISAYYDTYDVSKLGKITFNFYHTFDEYRSKNRITDYSVQRDDFGASRDGRTVYAYFDRVVFEGTDANTINWLNDQIKQMEDYYQIKVDEYGSRDEMLNDMLNRGDSEWYIVPRDLLSVYYDEAGNVSVGYHGDWYMGGVHNDEWASMNYNIYTGRELWLNEVMGVDWETARKKVNQAFVEQEDYCVDAIPDVDSLRYVTFYFDQDTVTLCFDSYDSTLELGSGGFAITLSRH